VGEGIGWEERGRKKTLRGRRKEGEEGQGGRVLPLLSGTLCLKKKPLMVDLFNLYEKYEQIINTNNSLILIKADSRIDDCYHIR
jgi:hypothetical protein